jgi:hypothetical protein
MIYVPWPFDRDTSIVSALKDTSIEAIMPCLDGTRQYAACVIIASTSEGSGDAYYKVMTISYTNPTSAGLLKENPAPLAATTVAYEFAERLQHDGSFQECRTIMRRFKQNGNGPGVMWLKNIFKPGNGCERHHFKKISPGVLLQSLQISLNKISLLVLKGGSFSMHDLAAIYSTLEGGTFNCTLIQECWPEILKHKSAVIANLDVLFGFFLAYSHQGSDSVIITQFQFPMTE